MKCLKCNVTAKNPRRWFKGYCPKCLDMAGAPMVEISPLQGGSQVNPVDIYWHQQTLKELMRSND